MVAVVAGQADTPTMIVEVQLAGGNPATDLSPST
jgi:hypothetical protein